MYQNIVAFVAIESLTPSYGPLCSRPNRLHNFFELHSVTSKAAVAQASMIKWIAAHANDRQHRRACFKIYVWVSRKLSHKMNLSFTLQTNTLESQKMPQRKRGLPTTLHRSQRKNLNICLGRELKCRVAVMRCRQRDSRNPFLQDRECRDPPCLGIDIKSQSQGAHHNVTIVSSRCQRWCRACVGYEPRGYPWNHLWDAKQQRDDR